MLSGVRRTVWRWVRVALFTLGGIVALAGLGLLLILQLWPGDDFRFLGNRNPVIAGQMSPMEVDDFVSPGRHIPAREYRIYSWQEDFSKVEAAASRELAALGYVEMPTVGAKSKVAFWTRTDGRSVWLQAGRSRSRKDAFGSKVMPDLDWVTVICSNQAPESWITHVRIAFEPSDW